MLIYGLAIWIELTLGHFVVRHILHRLHQTRRVFVEPQSVAFDGERNTLHRWISNEIST